MKKIFGGFSQGASETCAETSEGASQHLTEEMETGFSFFSEEEKLDAELVNCLNQLLLHEYKSNFELFEITYAALPTLNEARLKRLIPDLVPRRRLEGFIQKNFLQEKKSRNGWEIDSKQVTVYESDVIAKGGFGKIVKGEINVGNATITIACKQVPVDGHEITMENVINETKVMSMCHHPNILKCFGAFFARNGRMATMCLEYCTQGDLLDFSEKFELPPLQKVNYLIEIVKGIGYLHSKNIIHRDIKLANILVFDDKRTLKICDFGTSKLSRKVQGSFVGTPVYLAPEVFFGDDIPNPKKLDIYSLGILMWEVMTEDQVFVDLQKRHKGQPIKFLMEIHGDPNFRKKKRPDMKHKKLKGLPDDLLDLMELCWDEKAEERPSCMTIMEDLINVQRDLVKKASRKYDDEEEEESGEDTDEGDLFSSHGGQI